MDGAMKKKVDGIKEINGSMWMAYKELLSGKDKPSYLKKIYVLELGYDGELKWFCRNLASVWEPVAGLIEGNAGKGSGISEIHRSVSDIQNSAWAIYKAFMKGRDMRECTEKYAGLARRYDYDKDMKLFAQTLILSWVPVINSLADDFRNGMG